jgi:alcohol dehydrogenase class IV
MTDELDIRKKSKKSRRVRFPVLPEILFGGGVRTAMGENLAKQGVKKVLFIADPVMQSLGYTDDVRGILEKSGISSVLFSAVQQDPPVEEIEETGRTFNKEGCDAIVALGGGSSMDAAKATSLRVSHPGAIEEYGISGALAGEIRPPLPSVVCIPTTSGTGSETNSYAVITDTVRNQKFVIASNSLVPKLAVIDPELTKTLPPAITAQTGIDALAHCVEGLVGTAVPYHPYYEALGFYGVRLIGRSLRNAVTDGEYIDARTDMCMAAIYGGLCFSKGLGLGHAIGHVLGAIYHKSHGLSVSVPLLCFVRHNLEACRETFADLAYMLDRSQNLEAALKRLYGDIGLPATFGEMDIKEADLPTIAFETSKDVPNIKGNPIPPGEDRILELLKEFY